MERAVALRSASFCERGVLMRTRRFITLAAIAGIMSAGLLRAADSNNYTATILVSNEPGEAPVFDAKLVNAWGIATAGSSPWWVADNGTDWSTVYNGAGTKLSREVVVTGAPTGIVGYTGSQFLVFGHPATFMWATESGSILGWNSQLPDTTHAVVMHAEADAVYKGLAIHANTLYTTDFAGCSVDTLDGTFTEFDSAGGFEDPSIPSNYCPFGIQAIGDSIFVTYALKGGDDDVAGQGHGFVRQFDVNGNLIAEVADHGQLNSPWGLAMAPSTFGRFGGCLLVGNFGDGEINAYCLDEEGQFHFQGTLRQDRKAIVIDGLWGIGFGNNAAAGSANVLYFAAGPDEESNGYFGKVEFTP
jgi:uncharacterized protein (TIGR03118 family)